jgi:hypothetical protein
MTVKNGEDTREDLYSVAVLRAEMDLSFLRLANGWDETKYQEVRKLTYDNLDRYRERLEHRFDKQDQAGS